MDGHREAGGARSATDPAELAQPVVVVVSGVSTETGSIQLTDGDLVFTGDIGTHLCELFRATDPDFTEVDSIDARRVTFLGSPGLTVLAAVAQARGAGVPLWADRRAVLRPLEMVGLVDLFDVGPAED